MKTFVLTIFSAICIAAAFQIQNPIILHQDCYIRDAIKSYRDSIYDFVIPLYNVIARQANGNFVTGLLSVWTMLAGIAEGCNEEARQELFKILKLSNNACIRENLYKIATTRTKPVEYEGVTNSRNLFIDASLAINPLWLDFVSRNSLLDVSYSLINNKHLLTSNDIWKGPGLNTTGNSLMLDSNIYRVLWTTPFAGAVVERSPFYNQAGEEIGSVDLMRVKRKAKMGYVKSFNGKVLELPVDSNGHYVMIVVIFLDNANLSTKINKIHNNIIYEMINSLKESHEPFEIAIPRIDMNNEIDMKTVVETLGVKSIWTNPETTKYISTPPAFPTSYVQRTSLKVHEGGFPAPLLQYFSSPKCSLGLDPRVGTDFIANRPFLMGLFDVETYTPIIGAGFIEPTYPKNY